MKNKSIYHGFGLLAFLVAMVTYMMTVQPGVPFWDCGEFSAAAIWQQVPHPPGAPLFLMVGKVFHTLLPFGDDGWRINMLSVFSTAATVWLLYIITVKVIWNFRKDSISSFADELAIYGSAFVGALAVIYSDTIWFNAVESEVYAASTLFVAIVVYLMMRWNEEADNPGHERYLLLIAYLMGLSTGVHLLAILTIFSIVMLVYFRKYEYSLKSFILMGAIAVFIFGIIYPGIVKWIPAMLDGNLLFKNDCNEYIIEGAPIITVFTIGVIGFAGFLLWYAHKKKWEIVKLVTLSFLLMIVGYSTYTQILLRSNANPPMNENEPKNLHSLTSYLGREQYGQAPTWPRRYQTDDYYVAEFTKKDKNNNYIYGEWKSPVREEVRCKDVTKSIALPVFKETNFSGEMKFMWKYQIYHMYIRYFLWNYMGRTSDIQNASEAFDGKKEADFINYKIGYKDIYPIRFWAIPLLFGFFGLFFHFWKDPKMAFTFLIMFLLMGVIATLQQNQQEPQPRERDYFYAGSFLIWCMWIAMGTYFLIDWISKKEFKTGVVASIVIVSILIVPVNMAYGGWKLHSRAGNHLPFDYSYNILQSCEKDAILFTNGDNDTFPLWYLQDVMGVRRDIRIVNLSLGNTLWYVHQLKNRSPWGAKQIPLSFSNASLTVAEDSETALTYDLGKAQKVTIPVPKDVMAKYTDNPMLINNPAMSFTFVGKPYTQRDGEQYYLFRVQDKLVLDILQQVNWKRPVYFSTTVGGDAYCGLEPFFRIEGMVQRICPVQQKTSNSDAIDEKIMEACLLNIDNSDNYHKEPKYGMKLRNLNNMDVFYDEVHRRLMMNYRSLYTNFAAYYLAEGKDRKKSIAILDTMNKYISYIQFPMPYELEYRVARIYAECGEDGKVQAEKWADITLKSCLELIKNPELQPESRQYGVYSPHRIAASMYEIKKDFAQARQVLQQLLGNLQQAFESVKNNQAAQEDAQRIYYTIYDVQTNIDEMEINELESQGKVKEAIAKAEQLLQSYEQSQDPNIKYFSRYIQTKLDEIRRKHNLQPAISISDTNK
jgi:tetratricopeptide (TPR) repeat protein